MLSKKETVTAKNLITANFKFSQIPIPLQKYHTIDYGWRAENNLRYAETI